MSILYAIFALFWLVLDSSLVYITDFTLRNIKDFILTESKLLLLSCQFAILTLSSSCISCTNLGVFSVCHTDFLLFVYLMHKSGLLAFLSHLFSSPGAPVYCAGVILLPTCTACFPKCQTLPLAVCCTTVLTVVYHKLFLLLFVLLLIISLSSLATMYVIKVSHIFHSI